ncbi:MAG TPA: hypothetical protein VFZ34_08715 [Blastocatellia bacterium]|nr:hypothetical protein [Blastocatellia bacterium]
MKSTICSLLILSSLAVSAWAQTSLTTNDVLKWRAANPDRAEHFIPQSQAAAPRQKSQEQLDAEFQASEKAWNARLAQAQENVREYKRRAHLAEIEAAQLRNVFMHPDPEALNARNERVAAVLEAARAFRHEESLAQAAVNDLLEVGRRYGFQLVSPSPRLRSGAPNLEYYRSRFLALQKEIQDERLRVEALQLRTNRLQTMIHTPLNSVLYYPPADSGLLFYPNNGAADAFYLNRLRREFSGLTGSLQASQARLAILLAELEELQEEGRRAGVPPGIFR